jgi:uncharacterized phiE125 gp8 family phage protein
VGADGAMRVETFAGPAALPLDMEAVKVELRIDADEQDDYVTRLIGAAAAYFEKETGYALITRTLDAFLRQFPKATNIRLPFPPLISVTSVTTCFLGVDELWDSSNYHVDHSARHGSVVLIPGTEWPDGVLFPPGVTIRYDTGFGAAGSDVPEDILECLMGLIAFWDDVPEAVYVPGNTKAAGKVDVMPLHALSVIERYRRELEQ